MNKLIDQIIKTLKQKEKQGYVVHGFIKELEAIRNKSKKKSSKPRSNTTFFKFLIL